MSPQETQALETFLNQLVQAKAGVKDPQAEAMINGAISRQPDAAYLLVQRAMLMDQALAAAKSQIAQLQSQLQAAQTGHGAAAGGSFLDPASAWGNSAQAAPVRQAAPAVAASAPYAAQPPVQPARGGFLSGGFGSTLGTIAATAAGVAGGAFLFQGLENLLHPHSGNNFLGDPLASAPREETIINNYYGNDASSGGDNFDSVLDDNFSDDSLPDDDSSVI